MTKDSYTKPNPRVSKSLIGRFSKSKTHLLVYIQLPENLRRVQKMLVLEDLLRIERQKRQVQQDRDPVAIDDKEEGQERVDGSFRDDVGIQAVAQVDRVDVVAARKGDPGQSLSLSFVCGWQEGNHSPFQITVHDREENLDGG